MASVIGGRVTFAVVIINMVDSLTTGCTAVSTNCRVQHIQELLLPEPWLGYGLGLMQSLSQSQASLRMRLPQNHGLALLL